MRTRILIRKTNISKIIIIIIIYSGSSLVLKMESLDLEITLDRSQFHEAECSESCGNILEPAFLIKLWLVILRRVEMGAMLAAAYGDKKLSLILKYIYKELQDKERLKKNLNRPSCIMHNLINLN